MILRNLRPWLQRAAVGGTTVALGVVAFPHFEDSYWNRKYPERVTNKDSILDKTSDSTKKKKRLVLLGTGWASISVLKNVDRDKYDITVISPRNYFLFTPLLPSVCSGTVTPDAVTVEIRDFTSYKALPLIDRLGFIWRGTLPDRVRYIYAGANDIDLSNKTVKCESRNSSQTPELAANGDSASKNHQSTHLFEVPYDMLVVATGATTNSFRTEGVDQYCHYLKETGDATLIRQAVLEKLEQASLPNISDEERQRLLSFWVVGGGPTAVEFAAELQDFLQHDVVNLKHSTYSRCSGKTSVSLVQSNQDVLPGYPKQIRDFTLQHLVESGILVKTKARASKVTSDTISVYDKTSKQTQEFPYSLCVWATGVAPGPLIKKLISKIPEQASYRTLKTDTHCRVLGTDGVFAVGDCSDIDVLAMKRKEITDIYDKVQSKFVDSRSGGGLSMKGNSEFIQELHNELESTVSAPLAKIAEDIKDTFEKAKSQAVATGEEFQGLTKIDLEKIVQDKMKRQKYLPPTAQVAHQQGHYLGKLLSNPKIDEASQTWTFDHNEPFEFQNLGQLVYVGGHMAALSIPGGSDFDISWNGSLTNYVWHAAYFGMLESMQARTELLFDWTKSSIFGRSTALDTICSTDSTRSADALQQKGNIKEGKETEGKPWWRKLRKYL